MIRRQPLRHAALALTLVGAGACTTLRATPIGAAGSPPDSVSLHGDVRVTRRDGGVVELDDASVVHDSVVGWVTEGKWVRRRAVARAEVAMVERHETDGGRTAALILIPIGAVVLLSTIAFVAVLSQVR